MRRTIVAAGLVAALFGCGGGGGGTGGGGGGHAAACPDAVGTYTITEVLNAPGSGECSPATLTGGNGFQIEVSLDPAAPGGLAVATANFKCSGGFTGCKLTATCTMSDDVNDVEEKLAIDFEGQDISGTVDLGVTTKSSGMVCEYHFDVTVKRD